ncbi:cysteine proteinase [Phlyctochytrium arcticum]|nr:cysteine proteinase [Phlyctochytrium arcticum]
MLDIQPTRLLADDAIVEPMEIDAKATVEPPKRKLDIESVLPLPEDLQEEDRAIFKWTVTKYNQLRVKEKEYSPEFTCAGSKWKVLLFPHGNQTENALSVFVDSVDAHENPDPEWHKCATFGIGIMNPKNENYNFYQVANHRFNPNATDWGFNSFSKIPWMYKGHESLGGGPIIEDEEFTIIVWIRVIKDETGVLWHKFENWDSKKKTGFVGLKNQGATCYMNSLLQSLYFTSYFRRATFEIPTENDEPAKSIALALQRVFYNLQFSEDAVGTTELTKSFGWDTLDSFMQHDVQEFNRVLQDNLESKMKGTKAEGAISRLFVGKMKSYITCINVPYESSRVEDFYDIQLNVKGCKNLKESFDEYVAVETLDGDNKYQAEGFGLQDAKKGVIFRSYPPVLHLQLKRFEYDIERDAMVKINDRHEYPLEIDLDPYLEDTAERAVPQKYHLHGVLVHSGDLHGGHYCAFLRPKTDEKWFKFDDDRVIPARHREVFEDNFGGENPALRPGAKPYKRYTNAYMLVYIRESDREDMLAPISRDDIPAHLRTRLEQERAAHERQIRERDEAHKFLQIKVLTDDQIARHVGFDLWNFNDVTAPISSFKVPKQDTFAAFKDHLAQKLGVTPEKFRVWTLVGRQNRTIRPDAPIPDADLPLPMERVYNKYAKSTAELRLYIERLDDGAEVVQANATPVTAVKSVQTPDKPAAPSNEIVLFLKYYDPTTGRLSYAGRLVADRSLKTADIVPTLVERVKLPPGTPLKLFEEVKPEMIDALKPKMTFAQAELGDGDIICFQQDIKADEEQLPKGAPIDVAAYFDQLRNRVTITFKEKGHEREEGGHTIVLSRKMSYQTVAQAIARELDADPRKVKLLSFMQNHAGTRNGNPIKYSSTWTLELALGAMFQPRELVPNEEIHGILVYELLEINVTELETKRYLKIAFVDIHNKDYGPFDILLPKTARVTDVFANLEEKLANGTIKPEKRGINQMRLFESSGNCRIQRMIQADDVISIIKEGAELYAEDIPMDEENLHAGDRLVHAFHYNKDPSRGHGIPFTFVIKNGEVFSDTKQRLQDRMGMNEKDFAKVKFTLVPPDQRYSMAKPRPIEDGMCTIIS